MSPLISRLRHPLTAYRYRKYLKQVGEKPLCLKVPVFVGFMGECYVMPDYKEAVFGKGVVNARFRSEYFTSGLDYLPTDLSRFCIQATLDMNRDLREMSKQLVEYRPEYLMKTLDELERISKRLPPAVRGEYNKEKGTHPEFVRFGLFSLFRA